mgnify:CR=1 FL=1
MENDLEQVLEAGINEEELLIKLEAELKATQRELARVKEELSRKEYDEFYEDSYRFYMTKYGQSLRTIEELEKENRTFKNVVKAIESFTEELQRQNKKSKTENK